MKTKLIAIIAAAVLAIAGGLAVIARGSVQQQRDHATANAFQQKSAVDPSTISTTGGAKY